MTDEEINWAITEAIDADPHWKCSKDYCGDLNAMHNAESVLNTDELFEQYYLTLYETTQSTRWPVSATARQRAEAFLRTLGKWKN